MKYSTKYYTKYQSWTQNCGKYWVSSISWCRLYRGWQNMWMWGCEFTSSILIFFFKERCRNSNWALSLYGYTRQCWRTYPFSSPTVITTVFPVYNTSLYSMCFVVKIDFIMRWEFPGSRSKLLQTGARDSPICLTSHSTNI